MIPVLAALTISCAVLATFLSDLRRAALALWLSALSVGGLYLALGAEVLAIVQWILSTLATISFLFHSVMFGEYGTTAVPARGRGWVSAIGPLLAGGAFGWIILLGFAQFSQKISLGFWAEEIPIQGLSEMGSVLASKHLLSVEILGLTLFLVIVGVGVIARAEPRTNLRGGAKL